MAWEAATGWHYNPLVTLQMKLKAVRATLRTWNKETFGNINDNLAFHEEQAKAMQEAFDESPSSENRLAMGIANANLRKAINCVEMFWAQKARMQWLDNGDKNIAFYHAVINGRRKRNTISRLKVAGVWTEDQDSLKQEAGRCGMRFEDKKPSSGVAISNIRFKVAHSLPSLQFKAVPSPQDLEILRVFGFTPSFSSKQFKFIRWIQPITDFCLNVDGASKGNLGDCGGGGCIRDYKGHMLVTFSHFYGHGYSITAEARALCDGIRLADFLGLQIAMIQSDSLVLVNSLIAERCPSWQAFYWWREAFVMIQKKNLHLRHVYREANQVADSLATFGCLSKENKSNSKFKKYQDKPFPNKRQLDILCGKATVRGSHFMNSTQEVDVEARRSFGDDDRYNQQLLFLASTLFKKPEKRAWFMALDDEDALAWILNATS
ncbi:hypothetical protein Taro_047025 [Colocasia esculenta]|uniref:RNase H type-1 domain-containing protein n=1 Tax=Colocasia esculenta TaxID=4460 RepID=A0A843X082_COLES|nr:hypothetical protein [Colocasia esculenta]